MTISSPIHRACIQPTTLPSGKVVQLFSDGACETAKGFGGWAFILEWDGHVLEGSGNARGTTNNRMELTAMLEGLLVLKRPCVVRVVTDSQYLRKAFVESWILRWQTGGWKTSSRQPVQNRDLWEALIEQAHIHLFEFVWVKGHSGHPLNERVDRMAVSERKKLSY